MVFADANVVMELLLPNRAKTSDVSRLISESSQVAISMLTVHLAYYFGRKEGLEFNEIAELVADYFVEDLTKEDYRLAQGLLVGSDFEDALQLAVALRARCTKIMTLDKRFASSYEDRIDFIVV